MSEIISIFLISLSAIFVVADPIGNVPFFISLTAHKTAAEAQLIARRACVISVGILVFFALFGNFIFRLLQLELNSFRVAGGLLLLLTALDMLRAKGPDSKLTPAESQESARKEDIAIVPLSMPLLAGPGTMTTVVVLMAQWQNPMTAVPVIGALIIIFLLTYLIFRGAARIQYMLGSSGLLIVERVMGLILAAIAVQFIADGGRALLNQ